jgi:hypothetical protein
MRFRNSPNVSLYLRSEPNESASLLKLATLLLIAESFSSSQEVGSLRANLHYPLKLVKIQLETVQISRRFELELTTGKFGRNRWEVPFFDVKNTY